ncbi:MAG: hypothetical protein ACUVUC_06105 [Thermoguttaceae bacterium]
MAPVWSGAQVSQAPEANRYFKIHVVDEQTGRGVPLVELRTIANVRYVTDSNGMVAFHEPGLMGQRVFFYVRSHGYELPKDGFGFAGRMLDVKSGGCAEIQIKRNNIAERLYRITGAGIYRDSVLLGEKVPIRQPLLNAQVAGQDSVMALPYRGRIYWFWGDTNRPRYPLGLFETSGATSQPPAHGGLDPSVGVDLEYFVDKEGFSRAMCPIPGPGAVWIDGLLVVRDPTGRQRLVCHYARMKDLGTMLEHGLAIYNDQAEVFQKHVEFDLSDRWRCPRGHPVLVAGGGPVASGGAQAAKGQTPAPGGGEYFLFATPFATVRVKAQLSALAKQTSYEAFTCLAAGSRYDRSAGQVERDAAGRLIYAWKPGTDPITQAQERQLIAAGKIKPDEAHYQVRDVDTQRPVELHSGTIAWNEYRQKWILIAVESGGSSSYLGEVWFAEADEPTGPWRWAKKIVTHDRYSFYNPAHHPFFDQQGGRIIYFEGTYASTFSANPDPTPWYDYNQIMYRLDLADPRLPQVLAPRQAQ